MVHYFWILVKRKKMPAVVVVINNQNVGFTRNQSSFILTGTSEENLDQLSGVKRNTSLSSNLENTKVTVDIPGCNKFTVTADTTLKDSFRVRLTQHNGITSITVITGAPLQFIAEIAAMKIIPDLYLKEVVSTMLNGGNIEYPFSEDRYRLFLGCVQHLFRKNVPIIKRVQTDEKIKVQVAVRGDPLYIIQQDGMVFEGDASQGQSFFFEFEKKADMSGAIRVFRKHHNLNVCVSDIEQFLQRLREVVAEQVSQPLLSLPYYGPGDAVNDLLEKSQHTHCPSTDDNLKLLLEAIPHLLIKERWATVLLSDDSMVANYSVRCVVTHLCPENKFLLIASFMGLPVFVVNNLEVFDYPSENSDITNDQVTSHFKNEQKISSHFFENRKSRMHTDLNTDQYLVYHRLSDQSTHLNINDILPYVQTLIKPNH